MQEVYYRIEVDQEEVVFEQIYDADELYDNKRKGLIRSAKVPEGRQSYLGDYFQDFEFRLPPY